MGVMGRCDTQQGGFGAKISRPFFPLLFGKGVIRAFPTPNSRVFGRSAISLSLS